MDKETCVIYIGQCFTLEWYYDINGFSQAYEYFISITADQRRKFLILVKRMGDFGKISDKTKFRNEEDKIFEFKPQPDRYLCFFIKGKKIIVTNAFRKKTDKLPKEEKMKSLKYRQDYLDRNREE